MLGFFLLFVILLMDIFSWMVSPIAKRKHLYSTFTGCYVNNVPGDVMLRSACSHIIVVDVTAPDDVELTNYGDALSGWYLLWKKWNPFTSAVKIPTQNDIQVKVFFVNFRFSPITIFRSG